MEAGVSSEFAEALREIRAARESDVVERALAAAREQLGMDAAYIATVAARLERAHGSMVRLAQRFGAALPDA